MNTDDLARKTAAALSAEFGADLPSETEKALQKPEQKGERTRQYELLTHAAEVAVIAHFVVSIAPSVLRQVRAGGSNLGLAELKERIMGEIRRPRSLASKTAEKIVDRAIQEAQKIG